MGRKGEPRVNYHRYTDEEREFLSKCLETMSFPHTADAFNTRFGTSIATHAIEMYCRSKGLSSGKDDKSRAFTPEQILFITTAAQHCRSNDELYSEFCVKYGGARTKRAVVDALHRHVGKHYGNQPAYSAEQDQWLLTNGGKMDIPSLVSDFNRAFGTSKSYYALCGRMKSLGIDRSHAPISGKTRFTDEMISFIKGLPTDMTYAEIARRVNAEFGTKVHRTAVGDMCCKRLGFNRTGGNGQFQKGNISPTTREVGHESNLNGYISIKIDDKPIAGVHTYKKRKANWMPKHRFIYEQSHGPIPKGWIVVFLDNNPRNFHPDNLYAIPRSVHARM